MLKQQLNIKLQQKLSPLQIQVIKMLEYPTIELEQKINDELMDNPALEAAPEESKNSDEMDDFIESDKDASLTPDADWAWNADNDDTPDDIPDYRLRTNNHSINDTVYNSEHSDEKELTEFLTDQINVLDIDDKDKQLCEYIIGNIDADGYIRRDINRLVDDLAVTLGVMVTDDEMIHALKIIQTLEPAGVGARDLQECLILQMKALAESETSKSVSLAQLIIKKYFDLLARKQFEIIQQRTSSDRETMNEALRIIRRLSPNPGANFGSGIDSTVQTITPDFIIENNNGHLTVTLNNRNIPELRINQDFALMVNEYTSNAKNQTRERKDAMIFAKQKIESARWFIDSINQRNNTLMAVMQSIVKLQREYFLTGDYRQLKPMRLKDISEMTGFDVSTISRVSNSKYADTEWGVIPLKQFFSEGMSTHEGEEVSTKEIKLFIRETIDGEDKNSPITDDELTDLLNKKGYKIARRTVAKYREQLNIPIARLRRQF